MQDAPRLWSLHRFRIGLSLSWLMFSVLFSDCAAKLKELLQMADEALEIFNQLAKILKCAELTRDGICDKLLPEVDQQVARWLILASAEVSATFGDGVELLAGLDQLAKIRQSRPIPTRAEP
jgi:hypothetical protein